MLLYVVGVEQVAQVVTSSVRSVAREPVTILAVLVSQNESSVCVQVDCSKTGL